MAPSSPATGKAAPTRQGPNEPGRRAPGPSGAPGAPGNPRPGREKRAKRDKREKREKKARRAGEPHARRRGGRGRKVAVSLLALASAGTLAGGLFAAATLADDDAGPVGSAADAAGLNPESGPTNLPGDPAPSGGPVRKIAQETRVAPLKRVIPPDVLAVARESIKADQVKRIRKIKGVRDVIVVSGGQIELQGRAVNALAVDPSTFRSWTSPATAAKNEFWEALAADQFVVTHEAVQQLQLNLGRQYSVVAKTVPNLTLGASGPLVPGIDMLVSAKLGTEMGLVRDIALMVNAPGVNPAKLSTNVGKILGGGAETVNLNQTPGSGQATSYLDLYRQAATGCRGLSWTILAAIGQVESDHGRNAGRSSAGALGPMQFMPATWQAYGVDGDRDGKADIMNPYDAIPAAAKYLCANGAGKGGRSLYKAIFAYNHADWYVQKVLALAKAYDARYD